MSERRKVLVVGNGMVGHHFVEKLIQDKAVPALDVVVIGEEGRLAYDRVNLSKLFEGKTADDLSLTEPGRYERAGVEVLLGEEVVAIDRANKQVTTTKGRQLGYDKLVLATGSRPFVPPVKGREGRGCFVYRTIEDLEQISAFAKDVSVGAVIGGGLLGLEAANALRNLGLETHVVELAPRLMALQVDDAGGAILRTHIESLGVAVHTGKVTKEILLDESGNVQGLMFADGGVLETPLVLFSAGIRARDELARAIGLEIGVRGGIAIDSQCRTTDPDILAIGECAAYDGRTFGLVAPGYRMAEIAIDTVLERESAGFRGADMSTKLKLLGVDVASFGDCFGLEAGARSISLVDTVAGVYKKLVLSADKQKLMGGILVGDATAYGQLLAICQNGLALPPHPEDLILPADRESGGKAPGFGVDALPASATICSCHNVDKGSICSAIANEGITAVGGIKSCTKAGTGCGSCVTLITDLLKAELKKAGVTVVNHICEHFKYSRQELFHLVKVHRLHSFDELITRHGNGRGCEICKPAVASILASIWNEHVLDTKHIGLQDTNDRFLANVQRDGTYSVVPRVAGGEITPDQLITLGVVAKRYNLYTKITGGQRVDLFGARLDQLPAIWNELIAAGFESGHAYGKALRTVKSCVGSTWCRYGVQDSVGLAVRLENRYKGLRSPHKLKSAVSGCARECAEAQGKDFGIIATEKGYNLYVCGNGGMKPQHALLLAADIDEATVIRYVDRFLMFYVRTADRLQRTATWFNNLEGGIDYLRKVVVDDSLGIAAELEAEMQHVVDTYECEWKKTLEDPIKLRQFRTFVNADGPDTSVVFVPERGQIRPAKWSEKLAVVQEAL
ncbi:MAG TPA: nitrite reductase large subunit NirB [Polyangia bacterium]